MTSRAAVSWSGTSATATISSSPRASTSIRWKHRTGSRRPAGSPSSTSRNSAQEGAFEMTRMIRSFSGALAALVLVAGPVAAQVTLPSDNTAYGTTAAEFLLLGAGARGLSLGGAYAALATDISALYYNPAGIAQLTHPGAMVSTYSYVADTRYTWGGVAFPLAGGARSFGFQRGNL